jgi:hypothetical protein
MIAHILGNGPSRKDFINTPQGDIFGCNLSDPTLPLKATFIMDKVVISHIHNKKVVMNFPVIIPNGIRKLVNQCDPAPVILDVMHAQLKTGESTGHRGVFWLMKNGYKEIHMWGFDSMKHDSVESDTHQKIPEGPFCATNYKKWRVTWDKLLNGDDGKGVKVIIH